MERNDTKNAEEQYPNIHLPLVVLCWTKTSRCWMICVHFRLACQNIHSVATLLDTPAKSDAILFNGSAKNITFTMKTK